MKKRRPKGLPMAERVARKVVAKHAAHLRKSFHGSYAGMHPRCPICREERSQAHAEAAEREIVSRLSYCEFCAEELATDLRETARRKGVPDPTEFVA